MVKTDSEPLFEDPTVKRWLGSIVKYGTRKNYQSALKAYAEYTKLTPTQMIDEAVEDAKRDPRQRKDILLTRILGFHEWLKTDYEKKSRGTGPHRVIGKGVSDKLALCYTAAVRSFYGTYDLSIKLRGRRRIPRPRVQNKRMIVAADQVKVLVEHARSPRDRAIVLTNFQGGLDASTLCSIKYGDIAEGLAKNEYPLKLSLQRPKTGTDFFTFVGKDGILALKAYLADMRQRGVTFTHSTPLFLQGKRKIAMVTQNIQDMERELAIRAGFIDDKNNGHEFNPLGSHALRESFGSIMINSGVPDTIVDFWLGHEIGELAEAYKSVQYESLKEMYLAREKLLSVSNGKINAEELERKIKLELNEKSELLQNSFNNLVRENFELKNSVLELKNRLLNLEGKFSDTERSFQDVRKDIQELKKTV